MSTTILRSPDAWWVLTPGGATRIDTDATPTGAPRRPESDRAVLADIATRLEELL